ncbi:hypothetical protein EVAR_57781_1 [Eumeta japonica]|uniref:Uncharacterized protein n=1 Tax=Eumeta variegata TaxID=151549 RepID=A0A4C1Y6N3_EUMVA|nr:hypothetical protein EVAR_57781_1 [Eumeta japonica]
MLRLSMSIQGAVFVILNLLHYLCITSQLSRRLSRHPFQIMNAVYARRGRHFRPVSASAEPRPGASAAAGGGGRPATGEARALHDTFSSLARAIPWKEHGLMLL